MSNEEKKDIEDKINDAMAKIVSDTVGDVQPEKKSDPSASHVTARTQNLQDIRSQPDHLMCRMQDLRDHPVDQELQDQDGHLAMVQSLPSQRGRRRSVMCLLMNLNLPPSFSPKRKSIRL